ncbi:MAG: hypothetical protein K5923_00130 [Clostridia bacterium]|nr:hypothetical protein [Clostridia bacterium]
MKYMNIDPNGVFYDDVVVVTLSNSVSLQFKEYTAKNFKAVNCVRVESAFPYLDDIAYKVYKYRHAILTSEKNKVSLTFNNKEMLKTYDLKSYNASYYIYLDKHSKENVIEAINVLLKRDDVICAEPKYIVYANYNI